MEVLSYFPQFSFHPLISPLLKSFYFFFSDILDLFKEK